MLAYCATFDPKSANLSPLTAQPCIDSRTEHVAQQFQYIPTTGVIKPLWPSDDTELNADGHPMPIVPQSIHVATSNSSIPIQAVETDAGGATLLAKADVTRNKTITATARGRPVNASSPMGVYMTNDHPRPPSSKQETSGKLVLVFTPSSAASILSSPNSTTINIKGKPHPRRALDRRDHPKDHLNMVRTSTRIPQEPSEDSLRPEPHLEPVKRDITALLASLIPVDPAPPYQWKFTPMDDMS